MQTYRIYFVACGARISRPAEIIEAVDDAEAILQATQYVDGKDIELWRDDALIVRLPMR